MTTAKTTERHGTWRRMLGWGEGRTGFRMTGRLVGAYLGVSILHGLWGSRLRGGAAEHV